MSDQPVLNHLIRQIVRIAHPMRILLFGSAARGESTSESDLDLLVVVPDGIHRRRMAQELYRKIGGVGASFDLVVATPSDLAQHKDNPGLIYGTILEEGREVYVAA